MTFFGIPERNPARGREQPVDDEKLFGRIDRCGYDAGGEYGAKWIFSIDQVPRIFSASPSRIASTAGSESSDYVGRTFALTRPGDEVAFTVSSGELITSFDNLTSGRTMATMLAERPRSGGGNSLFGTGMTLAMLATLAMYIAGLVTFMYASDTAQRLAAEKLRLTNLSALIENASGYFAMQYDRPPGTLGELATWVRETGMDGDRKYGSTRDWSGWNFVRTGSGLTVVTALENPRDFCVDTDASKAHSQRWYCSNSDGRAVEPDKATSFALVLR